MQAELTDISELLPYPKNPKSHDIGAIFTSMREFGFIDRLVVNRETMHVLSGHGRIEALLQMRANRDDAPDGVEVVDGIWLIPVDYVDIPEHKEGAAVVTLNRVSEIGGWDDHALAKLLQEIADENLSLLAATGFDEDDLAEMLRDINPLDNRRLVSGGRDEFGDPPAGFEIIVTAKTVADKNALVEILESAGAEYKVVIQR